MPFNQNHSCCNRWKTSGLQQKRWKIQHWSSTVGYVLYLSIPPLQISKIGLCWVTDSTIGASLGKKPFCSNFLVLSVTHAMMTLAGAIAMRPKCNWWCDSCNWCNWCIPQNKTIFVAIYQCWLLPLPWWIWAVAVAMDWRSCKFLSCPKLKTN